jgi:hypothetical protein
MTGCYGRAGGRVLTAKTRESGYAARERAEGSGTGIFWGFDRITGWERIFFEAENEYEDDWWCCRTRKFTSLLPSSND